MKKFTYIKPAYRVVDIQMNDLCAGSRPSSIDVNVVNDLKKKQKKSILFKKGETDGMWDTKF